jgi:hypothetical protein
MYTLDMMDEKGKPDLSRARRTTEQADALRAQYRGQSAQEPEQRLPTPLPSDDDDLDYEQARALRRFKKGKGRERVLVTEWGKG